MPISRAKSADQLYDECRGADLVIVPDPALASALNRRLEAPHFGHFAVTPRRYVAGRERDEGRRAFLHVIDETDLGWRAAAHALGDVLQCWEHEGAPEAVLDYPRYASAATDAVLGALDGFETTSSRLTATAIDDDLDVAVVGADRLTPLERSVLPGTYTAVDPFTDGTFDPPAFHLFDSPAAVVDTVLDGVTPANADRVAVVLDEGSAYSSLVESALEAAEIPYVGGPGFVDDPDHRAFVRLLRASQSGSGLRIADVRPILTRLGADVAVEHDRKRLDALDDPELDWLQSFLDSVGRRTFDEALSAYEAAVGTTLEAFLEELGRLGLADRPVTGAAVDDLAFYLRRYEVPVDRRDEGVLLADATGSPVVDRPSVFYLGLDEGWTHAPPRRPWVDRDAEFDRHLAEFQLLLQNGVEQHYLVQDERGGRPVPPCLYFAELFDEPVERFSDLDSARHARTFRLTGGGFEAPPADGEPDRVETLSQSALNAFVNSPRDYLFGRLVDRPDRDYFAVGNLFHDFAEVVANHPDAVDAGFIEETVEFMLARTRPFDRPVDQAVQRTRFRAGLQTIVDYLATVEPAPPAFLAPDAGWWRNAVADHFGLDVDTPHTEYWFEDPDLGLKGKVDLVDGPDHLVDYKSGRQRSAYQVVSRSALDPPHDQADFQALAYLTWLRARHPDAELRFTFFHFLETLDDVVTGEASVEDCLTTVVYHPVAFADHVASEAAFGALANDAPADCRKAFADYDADAYRAVASAHPFPDSRDADELVASAFGRALLESLEAHVGDGRYVEHGAEQALRFLRDVRDRHFFADDLDAFEAFVDAQLADLNRYRAGEARFPVAGPRGEPYERYLDHRDLLLEDDA